MTDDHGDRMKNYEAAWDARLDVMLPIYARLDGRSFSRFTRGMERPFDMNMSAAMIATAIGLVERTHARIGYTQSDEISLVFLAENPESDILFGGRLQKLTSVLASLATALFTARVMVDDDFAPYRNRLPHFDCRVCQLPSKTEAANMVVWRYKDARKNAILSAAQSVFSPKQLFGRHGGELLEMLRGRGIDFDAYPEFFKRGAFVRRRTVLRELGAAELARIPEKHRPTGAVARSETAVVTCDFLACSNREAFLFDGAAPQFEEQSS
jgi:tRNA(His) 5'-end guanylyltransferase